MNMTTIRTTSIAFLTTGCAVLGFSQAQDVLVKNNVNLPVAVFRYCTYFGLVVLALGVVFWCFYAAHLIAKEARERLPSLWQVRETHFHCLEARTDELDEIRSFAIKQLGSDDVSSLAIMKACHKRNSLVFHKIVSSTGDEAINRDNIVGYFSVIPLKSRAAESVETGELNGTHISNEHVCRPGWWGNNTPTAIYIGGMAGKKGKPRAATIHHLKQFVESQRKFGVSTIYARPTTPAGLRLLIEKGFRDVVTKEMPVMGRVCKY